MAIRALALLLAFAALGIVGYVFVFGSRDALLLLLAALALLLAGVMAIVGRISYLLERWMDYEYKKDTTAKNR